jgi:UDP-glucose 6-dehydrogenase
MAKVDTIKRDLVKTIDAMKKNIEKFKKAKNEREKKKYAKFAYKLQDKKKKLEKNLDDAIVGIHADAELEIDEQKLRKQLKAIILSELRKKKNPKGE